MVYLLFQVLFLIWGNPFSYAESAAHGCGSFGHEVDFEFNGTLILQKQLLGKNSDQQIKEGIIHQLRYLRGYFINSRKDLPYSLTLAAETPEIKIQSQTETDYGQELKIDSIKHPLVQLENEYIKKSIARGSVHKKSPAISVLYSAKTNGYYCGPKELLSSISASMPRDPFLAYWSVKPSDRRTITWRHARFKINPCADEELADIPDPFYYWYFWDIKKTGIDAQKKAFNCSSILKDSIAFVDVKPEVSMSQKLEPSSLASLKTQEVIQASVIFGVIDEHDAIIPWKKIVQELKEKPEMKLADVNTSFDFYKKQFPKEKRDRGSQYFLNFISKIDQVFDVQKIEVEAQSNELIISGRLLQSSLPMKLVVWFGFTDVLSQNKPEHWLTLKKAFSTSQYIFYNGHSGLGENAKLSNLLEATQSTEDQLFAKAPKNQMIAYFSCYSYGYFGDDIVSKRQQFLPGSKTEILLTGSEFTSERGPLGMLNQLDLLNSKKSYQLDSGPWFDPKDQLILKYFSSVSNNKKSERQ